MPGEPRECRRNVTRYTALAAAGGALQLRAKFLELSKIYEKLALELEDGFGRLLESGNIGADVQLSLDEVNGFFNSLDSLR